MITPDEKATRRIIPARSPLIAGCGPGSVARKVPHQPRGERS